ncbi:hypothetical protein [Pseudomonas sp. MWU13-2517]|uniref:hypothetical protein n=1 Tax=Pseudomonas sp. MWU13-2517 TaxID=2929055 RepID=UPI00200DF658|nr:hypothetical protein [Pseudomonas sp. MWU13-2517]
MSLIQVTPYNRFSRPPIPPHPASSLMGPSPLPRDRRSAEAAVDEVSRRFPSEENAPKGDATLQTKVGRWLSSGVAPEPLIPRNACIGPFISQYQQALSEPRLQDWFRAKGLKISTVRVFSDSVVGVVSRDGKDAVVRFTTTDGSGWWAVGSTLAKLQKILSPSDLGIPANMPFEPIPRDIILDFYGVQPAKNEQAAPALGAHLKRDGWPPITVEKRQQWRDAFTRAVTANSNATARAGLAEQLRQRMRGLKAGDELRLDQQAFGAPPGSSLERDSRLPRQTFVELLTSQAFRDFLEKIGLDSVGDRFRISQGVLQQRDAKGTWRTLQAHFDDEVGKNQAPGVQEMKSRLHALVEQSQKTGNALYSTDTWDVRQALDYFGLGSPTTPEQGRDVQAWLDTRWPQPPLGADYASLTPCVWAPGALTGADCDVLKRSAASVAALFDSFLAGPDPWQALSADPDRRLSAFFDFPIAVAKADALAKELKLFDVADGRPLPRAQRHALLATALKLTVQDSLPGTPGTVAGYAIYQPGNLGRTQKQVRADVERHLQEKGATFESAPFLAHMFLAHAAPEMLIKLDPQVPVQMPEVLKQNPDEVRIGSPAWLALRLGCGVAEALAGQGCSRALNGTQIMALARLQPQNPEQEALFKGVGTVPLLEWAVMAGVFPAPQEGKYTPHHYQAAAQAFSQQQNTARDAFTTLTAEPPSMTRLLVEQLALLFPEMTDDEIRGFSLRRVADPRQHGQPQKVVLTEFLLAEQDSPGALVALNTWLNDYRTGKAKYRFEHPKISQAEFDERIKKLPKIAPLVAPAIEHYVADCRAAQSAVLKLMFAQLPLEDRKALEVGQIEFFSLREETGDAIEDDNGPDSNVSRHKGTHGTLIRYETGAVEPRFGYFEVFPGSMRIIKRTDLSYTLALGGQVKMGQKPYGPFANVLRDYRHAAPASFDFEAYKRGSEPKAGAQSSVIIEKTAPDLPAERVPGNPKHAQLPVPDTFNSEKIDRIVEGVLANSFTMPREPLVRYANQPTDYQRKRAFPFGTDDVFSPGNLRMVVGLLPFVGAFVDLGEGNIAQGLRGMLIDFASFAVTGGLSGAKRFYKGMKVVLPFNGRAFSMQGLGGASPFLRSVFNPLEGAVGVLKTGQKVAALGKEFMKGELRALGAGIYLPATAFEKCRWGAGVYTSVYAASGQPVGSRAGTCAGHSLYAVQKNNLWYAINPRTFKAEGAPLQGFEPTAT